MKRKDQMLKFFDFLWSLPDSKIYEDLVLVM